MFALVHLRYCIVRVVILVAQSARNEVLVRQPDVFGVHLVAGFVLIDVFSEPPEQCLDESCVPNHTLD